MFVEVLTGVDGGRHTIVEYFRVGLAGTGAAKGIIGFLTVLELRVHLE